MTLRFRSARDVVAPLTVEEVENLVMHGIDRIPFTVHQKAFLRARRESVTDAEASRKCGINPQYPYRWKTNAGKEGTRFCLIYRAILGDQVVVDLDNGLITLPPPPTTDERIQEAFDHTTEQIPEVLAKLLEIALHGDMKPAEQLRAIKLVLAICGVDEGSRIPGALTLVQQNILNWSGQAQPASNGKPVLPGNLIESVSRLRLNDPISGSQPEPANPGKIVEGEMKELSSGG